MGNCDHCHKNSAVMSYERKMDGIQKTEYYCLPCYEKLFLYVGEERAAQTRDVCDYCGTRVEEFLSTKILGCSYCYETMYAHIIPVIVRMQGDHCGHRGKKPPLSLEDEAIYTKMKFNVDVERENYRKRLENNERFLRQKKEMEKLVEFLSDNPQRQQGYMDKLERMERRGVIEEEIVW